MATKYSYNTDRDTVSITRPGGQTINYGYDGAGRLSSVTTPAGATNYTYDATTGNLTSAGDAIEQISYSYDGPLATGSTWAGKVAGSVSPTYDNNFWTVALSINGGDATPYQYDNDGLLTGAGPLAVERDMENGLITSTTLGVATDSRSYNGFGELIGYTASVNGVPVYGVQFTRDSVGRVTARSETMPGAANTYSYSYDPAGRLDAVTRNYATDSYVYDANSNRLRETTASGVLSGMYDAQDRLLAYGSTSYAYTANGELASQQGDNGVTSYEYDSLGNLAAATLPTGARITYVVDAENHRVGKAVNGLLQAGFLYNGDQIVAQLDGSNQLVSQFVYGTNASSPDYMVSGGVTYRIFSDQLGSPVIVVDTSTGALAEEISYDEFGNIISDTNPGFQPFGFAGGLYDQDTKLVHFGAREYSPAIGRWTAKDPTLFAGGDTNLYSYVLNDPVNRTDLSGLCDETLTSRDLSDVDCFVKRTKKFGIPWALYCPHAITKYGYPRLLPLPDKTACFPCESPPNPPPPDPPKPVKPSWFPTWLWNFLGDPLSLNDPAPDIWGG
jgi:RHS repeat-associated protein